MSDLGGFACSPSEDQWDEFDRATAIEMMSEWSHEDVRAALDKMSDHIQEWQGVPIPLGEDLPLVLTEGHPLAGLFGRKAAQESDVEIQLVPDSHYAEHEAAFTCTTDDVRDDERVVNEWYSRKRQCKVIVFQRAGRAFCCTVPVSPDRSMDRLDLWIKTIGASDAWDLDAEYTARDTLRAMLTERQWRHYDLTGCFLEQSTRSGLTYVFRRLRPTLALTFKDRRGRECVRCLAVLCMHPIGYYDRTWGGAMTPTDDVLSHLIWMRGDEANYWKNANQHEPSSPEAGI